MNKPQLDDIITRLPALCEAAARKLEVRVLQAATDSEDGGKKALTLTLAVDIALGDDVRIDSVESSVSVRYKASVPGDGEPEPHPELFNGDDNPSLEGDDAAPGGSPAGTSPSPRKRKKAGAEKVSRSHKLDD